MTSYNVVEEISLGKNSLLWPLITLYPNIYLFAYLTPTIL